MISAVCLFNRDENDRNMSVLWSNAAPKLRQPLKVRNIWSHNGHGAELNGVMFQSGFWSTVPKHSVVMLRVEGMPAATLKTDDDTASAAVTHRKSDDETADGGAVPRFSNVFQPHMVLQ